MSLEVEEIKREIFNWLYSTMKSNVFTQKLHNWLDEQFFPHEESFFSTIESTYNIMVNIVILQLKEITMQCHI